MDPWVSPGHTLKSSGLMKAIRREMRPVGRLVWWKRGRFDFKLVWSLSLSPSGLGAISRAWISSLFESHSDRPPSGLLCAPATKGRRQMAGRPLLARPALPVCLPPSQREEKSKEKRKFLEECYEFICICF